MDGSEIHCRAKVQSLSACQQFNFLHILAIEQHTIDEKTGWPLHISLITPGHPDSRKKVVSTLILILPGPEQTHF
jgi:hypothetical protein